MKLLQNFKFSENLETSGALELLQNFEFSENLAEKKTPLYCGVIRQAPKAGLLPAQLGLSGAQLHVPSA